VSPSQLLTDQYYNCGVRIAVTGLWNQAGLVSISMSVTADKRLFGRETELARLENARLAVLDGSGRSLLVSGDPGIGKTALVNHFSERLKKSDWSSFLGNSFEGEFTPPGWLWIQIIREALDTSAGNEAFALLSSTHQSAFELLLPENSRDQVSTRPTSMGVESRFEILDSVTRYISILSRSFPVMIWLEDLHWASELDTALWDFISQQTRTEKVLVIATSRSKDSDPDSALGLAMSSVSRLPEYEHLRLGNLDRLSMTELVKSASFDHLPTERITERVKRADGNPLFGRELARMPADSNELSGEISSAISNRIGDFEDLEIDLLRSAALFGREFRAAELAHIHKLPQESVRETFTTLENRAIVDRESPGSEEVHFTHPLIV
jgi:predicted ATPase